MGDDWRYREAGDRLATLREMGDSAKIGLSPGGRWEILTLCPPLAVKMEEFVGSLGLVNGGGRGGRPPAIFQFIYVPQLIRKMGPS